MCSSRASTIGRRREATSCDPEKGSRSIRSLNAELLQGMSSPSAHTAGGNARAERAQKDCRFVLMRRFPNGAWRDARVLRRARISRGQPEEVAASGRGLTESRHKRRTFGIARVAESETQAT